MSDNKPVITEEALSAAFDAWPSSPFGCDVLVQALKAAAPFIAASAWDEGKRSADLEWQQSYDLVTEDEERFVATNPYRSQA
jgi:hypothetical protein